jgi:hypothetical protein
MLLQLLPPSLHTNLQCSGYVLCLLANYVYNQLIKINMHYEQCD